MNDFKCNSPYSNKTTNKYLNVECVNEKSNVNIKTQLRLTKLWCKQRLRIPTTELDIATLE